jgi:hypothetical protein
MRSHGAPPSQPRLPPLRPLHEMERSWATVPCRVLPTVFFSFKFWRMPRLKTELPPVFLSSEPPDTGNFCGGVYFRGVLFSDLAVPGQAHRFCLFRKGPQLHSLSNCSWNSSRGLFWHCA